MPAKRKSQRLVASSSPASGKKPKADALAQKPRHLRSSQRPRVASPGEPKAEVPEVEPRQLPTPHSQRLASPEEPKNAETAEEDSREFRSSQRRRLASPGKSEKGEAPEEESRELRSSQRQRHRLASPGKSGKAEAPEEEPRELRSSRRLAPTGKSEKAEAPEEGLRELRSSRPQRLAFPGKSEKDEAPEEDEETSEVDSSKCGAPTGQKSVSRSKERRRKKREVEVEPKEEAGQVSAASSGNVGAEEPDCRFLGNPVPNDQARLRWPKRYQGKSRKRTADMNNPENPADEEIKQARRHYTRARVDGIVYNLNDDAYVQAAEGELSYICRIVEMFEGVGGSLYFTARWFYRASDTVIKQLSHLIDDKRVFLSEIHDDNPLDCLVQKLNIVKVPLNVDLDVKKAMVPPCDYYYDTLYLLPYSTFQKVPADDRENGNETSSTISSDDVDMSKPSDEVTSAANEVRLLDMYSGCGAMSTGLCLGANFGGLNLVTRWAVDLNEHACNSLKLNHPETEVRNEAAEDFLSLLNEWRKLCVAVGLVKTSDKDQSYANLFSVDDDESEEEENESDDNENDAEVFEVEKILAICYGDPKQTERGLYLKVRWKGYGTEEDTWEPIEGLSNCGERIKEFIVHGYKSKILPLPGDVDVVCGGPPCQGISGFNRFRNKDNPLADVKNKQLVVFMEVVEFLKPRFVLMENVVDLVKFANGFLGRYALGRLVSMNYQARMGMMAAGAYGLPQFRMRAFVWGAHPSERLPQYPLPTHQVVVRGVIPVEFENHTVAYDEGYSFDQLEKKLLLCDAISDLPVVGTYEHLDEMPYDKEPETSFQHFIRLSKEEMMRSPTLAYPEQLNQLLYDHRSLELNTDDHDRVCQIPKKKGANFRDLPGVRLVGNKVEWDPDVPRVYLKSGKPLVPDYAMSFVNGTSSKPFGRMWWDETVPTVVTRAEPHNQAILHPEQDRVLSIRENARLQGFPDYYKLTGSVKERYIQVGNAVAVPVARALGYALSLAYRGGSDESPLVKLPPTFSFKLKHPPSASSKGNGAS